MTFEAVITGSPKPSVSDPLMGDVGLDNNVAKKRLSLPEDLSISDDEEYELKLYEAHEKLAEMMTSDKQSSGSGLFISNIRVENAVDDERSVCEGIDISLSVSKDELYETEKKFKLDFIEKYFFSSPNFGVATEDSEFVSEEDLEKRFEDSVLGREVRQDVKTASVIKKQNYSKYASSKESNPSIYYGSNSSTPGSLVYGDGPSPKSLGTQFEGRTPDVASTKQNSVGSIKSTGISSSDEPIKLVDLWDILQGRSSGKSNCFPCDEESGYGSRGTLDSRKLSSESSSESEEEDQFHFPTEESRGSFALRRRLEPSPCQATPASGMFFDGWYDCSSNSYRPMSVLSVISEESYISEGEVQDHRPSSTLFSSVSTKLDDTGKFSANQPEVSGHFKKTSGMPGPSENASVKPQVEKRHHFSFRKVKLKQLDSFSSELPKDVHPLEQPPDYSVIVEEKTQTSSGLKASVSDGALIFCIKTLEVSTVDQLVDLVKAKLTKLMKVTENSSEIAVDFVHGSSVDDGHSLMLLSSLQHPEGADSRHLVFEARQKRTGMEAERCSLVSCPSVFLAGSYMAYVLLKDWN